MAEKIIHFMDYKASYKGNFINSIMFLDKELKKNNKEIVYVFPLATKNMEWIDDLIEEGNQVKFISNNFLKNVLYIRKVITESKVNIIHIHFANYKYILMIKLACIGIKGMKLITHVHNHYKVKSNKILEGFIRKVKSTDLYIGVSDSVTEDMIEKGFDKNKVFSVPNAIEFERLNNYEIIEKDIMGINTQKVILMFGFDYYRKGVDMVIEALKEIHNEYDVTLMISLSSNKGNVEKKIIEMFGNIPGWIRLVNARDDIATYYNLCDVFISASREEGFCYAAVEAAYCTPILIASDIPGQNSLKIPHTISYSIKDINKLKASIIKALSITPENKNIIKDEQRMFVVSEYNLEKWSKRIIELY